MANGASLEAIERAFWDLLRDRYPATAWWWGKMPADWFPEWSGAAFARETEQWLQASALTLEVSGEPVRHWGRFARWAARRISGQTWRRPGAPLSHARHVLRVVRILDPSGQKFRLDRVLERMTLWLGRIRDVAGTDYWTTVELDNEWASLSAFIRKMPGPSGVDPVRWTIVADRAQKALRSYRESVKRMDAVRRQEVAWGPVARLDPGQWQNRREFRARPRPKVKFLTSIEIIEGGRRLPGHERVRYQLVPWLGHEAWVRRDAEPVVFYGPTSRIGLVLAQLLAFWMHQSVSFHPLTWALADPAVTEGGLQAWSRVAGRRWPEWVAVRSGLLLRWLDEREVLACGDAWLWLEPVDAWVVGRWLGERLSQDRADAIVPRLVLEPGRCVMADGYAQEFLKQFGEGDLTHSWWTEGPLAPDFWPAGSP